PGDHVVILLGGHGSQVPEDPNRSDNYKADGMNEAFMPRDVKDWNGRSHRVTNSIVDHELRDWLKAIRQKGANLWVVTHPWPPGARPTACSPTRSVMSFRNPKTP